jgi:hypothetical protein
MLGLLMVLYLLVGYGWVKVNPVIEKHFEDTPDLHAYTPTLVRLVFMLVWPYFFVMQIFEAVAKLSD